MQNFKNSRMTPKTLQNQKKISKNFKNSCKEALNEKKSLENKLKSELKIDRMTFSKILKNQKLHPKHQKPKNSKYFKKSYKEA